MILFCPVLRRLINLIISPRSDNDDQHFYEELGITQDALDAVGEVDIE